ncbi:TIGR04283 family arsenosugar biosynthesis glycosyltransferase [Flagellatimonas centrodinii]|uniref:TIGR04283 family arsenosugar biosynthesis glycosyltransferase n=1 Tax=Flagellatimonas centrodinii TaxID=2806210 RepID=UPI001FEDA804|nr:TIGR04283 family arsenosugar biosynthesis glycosyltransferase [Flagellatimonas centrodinii]ULQ45229.1 TIGR04283 family arsenosugar biosynthesis glycosyltransferase [Flagellatimonas centrodinii]
MATLSQPALAVIIPTLDEAETLPRLLAELRSQTGVQLEIRVVDGGSRDETVARASAGGATVHHCVPPGRGRQMNLGHAHARAPWRLFLHADSRLSRPDQLHRAIDLMCQHDPRQRAGHWPLHFDDVPAGYCRLFRFLEAKSHSGRPGTIHGDQGLLIHRDFLDRIGGFDEGLPFFEDVRLSTAIFRSGSWVTLPDTLRTSARRFHSEGVYSRYAAMGLMMLMDAAGDTDFLREMPGLYRAQADTAPLPALSLVTAAAGRLARNPDRWPQVVRFMLENQWQLPLIAKIALSSCRHPPTSSA